MAPVSEARALRRARNHADAIALLKQNFPDNLLSSVETAVEAAINYRLLLQNEESEHLLVEATQRWPDRFEPHRELYWLKSERNQWADAAEHARQTTILAPDAPRGYFHLGRCMAWLEDREGARTQFMRGLEKQLKMPFEGVISHLEKSLEPALGSGLSTEFISTAGNNNIGAFVHTAEAGQYFTKVALSAPGAKAEEYFYTTIAPSNDALLDISPRLIRSTRHRGVHFLTLEKVDSPTDEGQQDRSAIDAVTVLAQIPYAETRGLALLPKRLIMHNRPASILQFFTKIHLREQNERLFDQFRAVLQQNNYPCSLREAVSRVAELVFSTQLYARINPDEHYGIVHADFVPANVLASDDGAGPKLIDWGGVNTGLRYVDLARYFSDREYSWREVLRTLDGHGNFLLSITPAERVYFQIAFLLFSIIHNGPERILDRADDVVDPLVEAITTEFTELPALDTSALVEELIVQREEAHDELKALTLQANQHSSELRGKVAELEALVRKKGEQVKKTANQSKEFKDRFAKAAKERDEVLNSTSWKLTRPLRWLGDEARRFKRS